MEDIDWTGVIFGMGVLVLGTVILVVVLIVGERFYRARAQRQDLLRMHDLVERYERYADEAEKHQESVDTGLSDVRARLTEIERMLREVE